MSIIVVEGCDGSGKTTLVEKAREGQRERYFVIVRASRYPPNLQTAFKYLQWIKHQRELDLVLDRIHFISDRIYGPILRNEDLFGSMPIDFGIQEVGAIVYCRPPTEKIRENVAKLPQMKGVAEKLDDLIRMYDVHMEFLRGKGFKILTYDYTVDDAKSFWRHVWSQVPDRRRATEALADVNQALKGKQS